MKLLIINGPNINMIGIREPELYGNKSHDDLVAYIENICESMKVDVEIFQSNHEGDIITRIQDAYGNTDGIIINPAAYTHTSIGILDALKAVAIPTVEVHLSDPSSREDFRKVSYAGMACEKTFSGMGFDGYAKAVEYLSNI